MSFSFWSEWSVWLGNYAVEPVLNFLHINGLTDSPQEIASAFMTGALQLCLIGFLFRPLESWFPAEKWADRRYANKDFHLTWIMIVGLFPLFMFLILTPIVNLLTGGASTGPEVEGWSLRTQFTWLDSHPIIFFLVYYLVYDFVYYWMHRLAHFLPWWWAMHSAHHSQRQMSCWCNDRTIYLDGILQSFILASVGIFFGVRADEFAWFMLFGELIQNLSHANVRFGFGPIFNKIIIDPKFHRLHHMRFNPDRPTLHNCNFGEVFPFWDIIFGTALYKEPLHPTGVDDPMVDKDNELNIVQFQIEGHKRFWHAFRRKSGWKIGEVIFTENYEPVRVDNSVPHPAADDLLPNK